MNVNKYLRMKEKAEKLPRIEVTEEEFISLWRATGREEEEGVRNLRICKIMGSHVQIGSKLVGIKED